MDLLMKKFRIAILSAEGCTLRVGNSPFFLENQQAEILVGSKKVGELGIVHPLVVKAWDWEHPIALLEMMVAPLAEGIALQ